MIQLLLTRRGRLHPRIDWYLLIAWILILAFCLSAWTVVGWLAWELFR